MEHRQARMMAVLAAVLVTVFVIRYRRRSEDEVPEPPHEDNRLEIAASIFLTALLMVMFGWGARLYFQAYRPPADSIEIFVTGKQWMWKIQHPQGKREINELHVPLNRPVQLTMSSEDVIHSFFVPAFRVKQDVLPGRYTYLWFTPTKLGQFHLFCAEYCGTQHSAMRGTVHVVTPEEYEAWLGGASATSVASATPASPAELGFEAFNKFGCAACHNETSASLGPYLGGVADSTRKLQDGTEVVADEDYLRESIVNSQAKLVEGYQPVMPAFQGLLTEQDIANLIAYIKSLGDNTGSGK